MCYCDDSPGPTAFKRTEHKAIKAHQCFECRRTIKPGERYEVHSGIWDREASSFKWCSDCVALRAKVDGLGFCFNYGSLLECAYEALREMWNPLPRPRPWVGAVVTASQQSSEETKP